MAPVTRPSGTTAFWLGVGDSVLESFDRCGIRPSSLTQQQLTSAYRSVNLELSTWANRGVNLWARDLQTVTLIASTSTYNLATDTLQILDMYLRYAAPGADPIDRILYPISETDYASLADKSTPGSPTSFFYDRLSPTPRIIIWPVPTVVTNYSLQFYRTRQLQDANISGAQTPDIPYTFFEALCSGIAARLALKFAPSKYALLKEVADAEWKQASDANTEKVSLHILPQLGSYFE